ncbi:thioredoxin family protein [Novosphingobium lentum]|uniref:thioredoxin family protein n=1 Tax=Novosphingobium lentum TaxID=145287 RepID=UPI00082A5630|nr:thioredoxin family protein [Novosphingobium lentum]
MSRLAFTLVFATAIVAPVAAHAATRVPFEQASFAAAQAANKPILLEVHAWWCPTCASQSRTIEAALADPRNRDLVVFRINYDKQKPQWQAFGVHKQGTLIAYRGRHETGRLEFVTDKAAINALIARATS